LIVQAYLSLPNGRRNLQIGLEGGPSWINSDQYEINAKAEGTPSPEVMRGAMLRTILRERFKLMAHLETKEVPVYALNISKGGFKLQPLQDGSCDPPDPSIRDHFAAHRTGLMRCCNPARSPLAAWPWSLQSRVVQVRQSMHSRQISRNSR